MTADFFFQCHFELLDFITGSVVCSLIDHTEDTDILTCAIGI